VAEKMTLIGLAHDANSTKYLLKFKSHGKNIQYGEYEILPHEKIMSVINKVINGKVYLRKMRIPSGLTNKEIFKIIDNNQYLTGKFDKQKILEGMLFAETYSYRNGDSRQKLVNKMTNLTVKNLWYEWSNRESGLPYKSMFDGLILASIVEKEAMYYDDKKKVASVFLNRLKNKQKLQSDPTVQYHVDLHYGKKTKLRKSFFSIPSFHSTYYIDGIPLTAICNPSLSSIKAVFHPDKTNYQYFISMPDSVRLFFSKTYKEHLNYVSRMYQIRRDLNWRDTYGEIEVE
jgi:UPF0755 protein